MMTYQEKSVVENRLMEYAINRAGDERFKYAAAFGVAWAMLSDEQIQILDRYLDEWSK